MATGDHSPVDFRPLALRPYFSVSLLLTCCIYFRDFFALKNSFILKQAKTPYKAQGVCGQLY